MPPYKSEEESQYIVTPIPSSENILNVDDQDLTPTPIDIFKEILADQFRQLIQSLSDHFTTQIYLLSLENNKTINALFKAEKIDSKQ
jgi:hypothetical protein